MNTLAAVRQGLSQRLSSLGIAPFEYVPERIAPPAAVITPATPYIQEGDTFSQIEVKFDIVLIAGHATNETVTKELDQMIMDVINELDDVAIESVEAPTGFEWNNANYLGSRITIIAVGEITI